MDSTAGEKRAAILERIARARVRFGPPPDAVELIAVSKTFAIDAIIPFLEAGQCVFGENRVQEARGKWPSLRERFPDIRLHLLGPLQTNKVRDAVAIFDVIQSVDRDRLAAILAQEMIRSGKRLPCFVQVNIGEETQKSGIAPAEAVDFVARCRMEHGLDIVGLMCVPPNGVPAGPYFALLATLARQARTFQLSMGMSGDFEAAIAMGATHVRIGSALFGQR